MCWARLSGRCVYSQPPTKGFRLAAQPSPSPLPSLRPDGPRSRHPQNPIMSSCRTPSVVACVLHRTSPLLEAPVANPSSQHRTHRSRLSIPVRHATNPRSPSNRRCSPALKTHQMHQTAAVADVRPHCWLLSANSTWVFTAASNARAEQCKNVFFCFTSPYRRLP